MAKVQIKSEKITKVRRNISIKDIFFHIILHFGLLTIGISCYVGDLLAQKREGAPPITPSPFSTFQYQHQNFSYTHPYSPAYNTAPGRYDNRDRNLQATHQRGGCGSSAFPAF